MNQQWMRRGATTSIESNHLKFRSVSPPRSMSKVPGEVSNKLSKPESPLVYSAFQEANLIEVLTFSEGELRSHIRILHVNPRNSNLCNDCIKIQPEGYIMFYYCTIIFPTQSLRHGPNWWLITRASDEAAVTRLASLFVNLIHDPCIQRSISSALILPYLSVGVTSPGDSFSLSSFACFASSWSLFSPWPSIEC